MSIVVKALKLGLTKGAEALGAEAADQVSKVFLKLIGYQSERDKKEKELREWISSVNEQLSLLTNMVTDLTNSVQRGFDQTKGDYFYKGYSDQNGKVLEYTNYVDIQFEKFHEVLNKNYKDAEDAKKEINKFVRNLDFDALLLNARNLASLHGQKGMLEARNLLENYTDACIVSMYDDVSSLGLNYQGLEYNYVLAIGALNKALTVMVAVKNYNSGVAVDAEDSETIKWLDDQVALMITPTTESFLSCVDRLILSTYQPANNIHVTFDIVFGNLAVIEEIGCRSQALSFLFTDTDTRKKHPGIVATEFLRPSLLNSKGESFIKVTPNGKSQVLLKGTRMHAPEKYLKGPFMPHWYKVTDKNEKGQLKAFEDSDIVVMRYEMPYEDIAPDNRGYHFSFTENYELNSEWPYTEVTRYRYYDRDSLEEQSKQNENSIAIAFLPMAGSLGIIRPQVEAFPISVPGSAGIIYNYPADKPSNTPPPTGHEQFQFDPHNRSELIGHAKDDIAIFTPPSGFGMANMIGIWASFRPARVSENHSLYFYTNYYIDYEKKGQDFPGGKSDNVKLTLVNKTVATVKIGDYASSKWGMRSCQVQLRVFADCNGVKISFFDKEYGSDTNLNRDPIVWKDTSNTQLVPGQQSKLGIPLKTGVKTKIVFEVDYWLKGYDGGLNNAYDNEVSGKIEMRGRLVWPYPKLK
ncbi:MAG TPA: hypothetical protein VHA56_07370 [Mucilaginibacter sp.]|nr:hypothetical protein [Mucilaginibacter sp.]